MAPLTALIFLPLALLTTLTTSTPTPSSSSKSSSNATEWSDYTFPGVTSHPPQSSEVLYKRNYFYVGGQYAPEHGSPNQTVMTGQIYVEQLIPEGGPRRKYPLVFWHGAGQTGVNWLNTPDGRMGWASYFINEGYDVFIADQPQRGRSPWELSQGGAAYFSTQQIEAQFTAIQHFKLWPQAIFHTQWPGTGLKGDPIFDQFYASQVQSQKNLTMASIYNRDAGAALLDKIGPAILITHSEGGELGWGIADAAPSKLAGLFALEPSGPPFQNVFGLTYQNTTARGWGLTNISLAYEPAVRSPAELRRVLAPSEGVNLTNCFRQAEPARRLVNLAKVRMAMATTQASYHAPYDYCTLGYLRQGGVEVEYFNLTDMGILGNGHMSFLEKNGLDIAKVLGGWFEEVEK